MPNILCVLHKIIIKFQKKYENSWICLYIAMTQLLWFCNANCDHVNYCSDADIAYNLQNTQERVVSLPI